MIHIHPISLSPHLCVYVELVPDKSRPGEGWKSLVVDESRPLESVLLRFHRGSRLIQAVPWLDLFTSDPHQATPRSPTETALALSDGTAVSVAELMWLHGAVCAVLPFYDLQSRGVYLPRAA
ncbi:hypothetical protein N7676_15835 [Stenotrophomonas sp. GD03993]|uniref:hypothetical protein n=1 Tax=unclassified Stenotrophomonas TaxID=196198 RepID=UPI00244896C9|nr:MULTISPECIES: hypothetical protein [unclassified Stenotrophomonas]MDH0187699.1 hypothetical protein [Stenotrophomonas sp. GD04051]MDH0465277.1 hypothetical protein [Stenotrophomonas sp. GD03993]MDH0877878.1 hypothetical protein [Stenotrophomonas sp. GD03877]